MIFTDMTPKQVILAIADVIDEVKQVVQYNGEHPSSVKIFLEDGLIFNPWDSAADAMTLVMQHQLDVVHLDKKGCKYVALEWLEEDGEVYSGSFFPVNEEGANQMLRIAICEAVLLKNGMVEEEDDV